MRCPRCGCDPVSTTDGPGRCAACGFDLRRASLRAVVLVLLLDLGGTALFGYALLSDRRFLWPALGLMIVGGLLLPSVIHHFRAVASNHQVSPS